MIHHPFVFASKNRHATTLKQRLMMLMIGHTASKTRSNKLQLVRAHVAYFEPEKHEDSAPTLAHMLVGRHRQRFTRPRAVIDTVEGLVVEIYAIELRVGQDAGFDAADTRFCQIVACL